MARIVDVIYAKKYPTSQWFTSIHFRMIYFKNILKNQKSTQKSKQKYWKSKTLKWKQQEFYLIDDRKKVWFMNMYGTEMNIEKTEAKNIKK